MLLGGVVLLLLYIIYVPVFSRKWRAKKIAGEKGSYNVRLQNDKIKYGDKNESIEMTGKNTIVNDKPFQLVTVIKGNGVINGNSVKMGDNFVVCADQDAVEYDGTMTVMICTL
mgnify:FL=1